MKSNDIPVTDAELDQFYGRPVTQSEIDDAIERQAKAFDSNDLAMVVDEHDERILAALANHEYTLIGYIIKDARKKAIARRVSIEIFNKVDVIKPSQVIV